jgi:hypothetical protein
MISLSLSVLHTSIILVQKNLQKLSVDIQSSSDDFSKLAGITKYLSDIFHNIQFNADDFPNCRARLIVKYFALLIKPSNTFIFAVTSTI